MAFVFCGQGPLQLHGETDDSITHAQLLMGEKPRPDAKISRILADGDHAGNKDYRIPLLQGLLARDQHHLAEADALFQTAHERAPALVDPLFERAVTQEWRGEFESARALYNQLLTEHPGLRSALLGVARVDRAEYHLDDARAIYDGLLEKNSNDLEARAGLDWIALTNKQVGKARSGFTSILAADPNDDEAKIGLELANDVWRYQLDTVGGYVHNDNGSSWSGGFDLKFALDAFNTLEVGNVYNSNELPTQQLAQQVFLPTTDTRFGYYYTVPQNFSLSLTYDYRTHEDVPDEHWIEASGGTYLTRKIQWISGARVSFGAPQWDTILFRSGILANVTDALQAGVTGYYDYEGKARLPNNINIPNTYSFSGDLYYTTHSNLLLNLGVGYNPPANNLNFHTRAELPVTSKMSVLASFEHDSVSDQYISNLGLRIRW